MSLSQLDNRIGLLFFLHDVLNIFFGTMLGGSVFGQIKELFQGPENFFSQIGSAAPSASKFFINYIIIQAFVSHSIRLLWPHWHVIFETLRKAGIGEPKTAIKKCTILGEEGLRYGREIGNLMLIYLVGLSYGTTSPLILPFVLVYVLLAWISYRYQMLYIYQSSYESHGKLWGLAFSCMVWILLIAEFTTGAIMLANKAYTPGACVLLLLTPALYKFAKTCRVDYSECFERMPLTIAVEQPLADVPPSVYLPPALRERCAGWHPECGKVWENQSAPRYC